MTTVLAFNRPAPLTMPSPRPWLDGLVYDESDQRAHTFEGQSILSVTQILKISGKSADFSKVKATILHAKGLVGTAAHLAAHFYDEGDLVEASVDARVAPYVAGWKLFRERTGFAPELLETVVFSRAYGYIGRLDRVGTVDRRRRRVLLDIKVGEPSAARADLQTLAYEEALTEELGAGFAVDIAERWSVQLFPNGTYKLCRYPLPGRIWRHDRAEWLEALSDARALSGLPWRKPVMFDMNSGAPIPAPLGLEEPLFEEPQEPAVADEPLFAEPVIEEPVAEAPPQALTPDVLPPIPADASAEDVVRVFTERKDTVVARAKALAAAVSSEATCQAAVNYATMVDDFLRAAKAHFDPLVARARQPYEDRLAERKAVLDPLEQAKDALTGKAGAVTRYIAEQTRIAEAKRVEEQRKRDAAAEQQRQQAEAERIAAERQRRAAADAVERQRLAEEQARKEAAEAQRRGDAAAMATAAAAAAAAEQEAARQRQIAEDASRQAQEAEQRRDTTVSELVPETARTAVSGASSKANWTYEIRDFETFVVDVAKARVLKWLLAEIKAIQGWEQDTAANIVGLIDFKEGQCPEIPVTALQENAIYLRTRARADHDTLKWGSGIRFFDAGQTALAPASRRRRS